MNGEGTSGLQYVPDQGGMLYDPARGEHFSVVRRVWTVGGHWPEEASEQRANGPEDAAGGDANAVLQQYLQLPLVERLRFFLMHNQSEEGFTPSEARRVNQQTRGAGVDIFDREAFGRRYSAIAPVRGFAGLVRPAANGPEPLFPPPLQLLRRKEIYAWDSIDDLIREAGGDPALSRWSEVPAGVRGRLPWPNLQRVKLAPTLSGDAVIAVVVRRDLFTAVAYILRLPGGRWDGSATSASGAGGRSPGAPVPDGAPPANGDEWYNELLGGVHVAGRTVLGAFGLQTVAQELEQAEGEAIPDWARSTPGRVRGRSEVPGGGSAPSPDGRPPSDGGGSPEAEIPLEEFQGSQAGEPIDGEPEGIGLDEVQEQAPEEVQEQASEAVSPRQAGRIRGRAGASRRRPTAPPIDTTARKGSVANPVRSRLGGL